MPIFYLARVEPDIGEGAHILGNPDEERGEKDGDEEGHTPHFIINLEVHLSAEEDNKDVEE